MLSTKKWMQSLFLFQFSCLVLSVGQGNFNLYLSSEEMKRIWGLSEEFYYVFDGVANECALNLTGPVPAHINALFFTWQALGPKPLPYLYSIESSNSNSLAMKRPTLNISTNGLIPTEPQTFQVLLPCTPGLNEEVQLKLMLNVSYDFMTVKMEPNTTATVILTWKKICLEDRDALKLWNESSPTTSAAPTSPPFVPSSPSAHDNQTQQHEWEQQQTSEKNDSSGGGGALAPNDEMNPNPDDEYQFYRSTDSIFRDRTKLDFVLAGCSLGVLVFLIGFAASATVLLTRRPSRKVGSWSPPGSSNGIAYEDTSGNGELY